MKLEWWFFEGESSPALMKSEWSILIQIHGDRVYMANCLVVTGNVYEFYGRYNELVNGDYFMVYKPTNTAWWWLEPWNFEWISIQLGIIITTDELIFFRGVETSNQLIVGINMVYYMGLA